MAGRRRGHPLGASASRRFGLLLLLVLSWCGRPARHVGFRRNGGQRFSGTAPGYCAVSAAWTRCGTWQGTADAAGSARHPAEHRFGLAQIGPGDGFRPRFRRGDSNCRSRHVLLAVHFAGWLRFCHPMGRCDGDGRCSVGRMGAWCRGRRWDNRPMTKLQMIQRIAQKQSLLATRDVELAVNVMLEHMTAVSRWWRAHRDSGLRQLLAELPSREGGVQPEDWIADIASREVRPAFQAGHGTSRARGSADARSMRGLGRRGVIPRETRARRPGRTAGRGAHAAEAWEIAESGSCGGDATGAQSMTDARRVLDSVFGFEALRPGQAAVIEALLGGRNVLTVMTDGLRARCIASVSPDFSGIHRNPESIVFWANLAKNGLSIGGESHEDPERERREVRLRPADRLGPRRTGGGRQAWAAGCGGDGGGGVRAAEVF